MRTERNNPNPGADAHWSDDRMLERLYGLDPPPGLDGSHLDSCPECAPRWQALQAARAQVTQSPAPAISEDRLRAQRVAVFDRLEHPARQGLLRFAPVAATALLLVMGIALHTPRPVVEQQTAAVLTQSDRELFSEIAVLVEEDTPRATDAFRGLFDGNEGQEVQ